MTERAPGPNRANWALLGAGGISTDFLTGLAVAQHGRLHAVGARDGARARAFADAHGAPVAGTYDEILARDDIDAVYIGTVHNTHAELAHAALAAGKAVLCEKPMTVTRADTEALIADARERDATLVEAYKYRFGPFAGALRGLIAGGGLGEITEIETSLGFAAAERTGRLFDPSTAGGAILDVGCYPVSLAVGIVDWAGRLGGTDAGAVIAGTDTGAVADVTAPRLVEADGVVGDVDEEATAVFDLGGITVRVHTAITAEVTRHTVIRGTAGRVEIPNVWGSRTESTPTAEVHRPDGAVESITVPTVQPMAAEGDATILALREGRTQAPEVPWTQSIAIAQLLDDWRAALD